MEFLQVGLKVDDIQQTADMYRALFGIEFEPVKEYTLDDATLNGEVSPSRSLVTHGRTSNGVEIELVQVLDGHTADEVVLGAREGISHFGFTVPDLDVAIADAEARGLRNVSEWRSDYVDFAFLDGAGLGGALVQLIQFNQERH